MTNSATGIGSMPGSDFAEATRVVLGEVGDLPYLVELPGRGPTGSMVGRTIAMMTDLAFDLQPAGWRLTGASGLDHRRAASLLAQDLDMTEDLARGRHGRYKVQVAGPWTMAATVERQRGDKILADRGARRDLAQALAEAVRVHCADLRRRLEPDELIVQIDEPALPSVLAGAIPTASGFQRHWTVAEPDASQALAWVAEAVADAGAMAVLHCCSGRLPLAMLRTVPLQAISFDLSLLDQDGYDDLGEWLEAGRGAWLGVVPATEPDGAAPTEPDLTRAILRCWSAIGYTEAESQPATTVTPSCGLAGASPDWAITALGLCRRVARNLSEEQGRIGA